MDTLDLIEQGKIKRYFRATRKLNQPKLVSHITQKAAGREPLFLEDEDYIVMMGILKENSEKHACNIYAFCLMPNHIHLLLSPDAENLYDAMRDQFSRYAMWFNRKYQRKGHLFGGPYRQSVCFDDGYLLTASLYIHLNPVRARIIENPKDYRWSSIRLYTDKDAPESFVDPGFVLNLLSSENVNSKERYDDLLSKTYKIQIDHALEKEDAVEKFYFNLVNKFPKMFKKVVERKHIKEKSGVDLLDLAVLESQIEQLKKEGFYTRKPERKKAKKFLVEQLIARGYKKTEIAAKLGMSRTTVYNILQNNTTGR